MDTGRVDAFEQDYGFNFGLPCYSGECEFHGLLGVDVTVEDWLGKDGSTVVLLI